MTPPPPFAAQSLELSDGSQALIRPIHAEDEDLLHQAFSRMSERSVYFRFFSPLKRLPEALAQRLAQVDYQDRFALIATGREPDGTEYILGVARYDRISGTRTAEVAVSVIDEAQRRGLGSALLLRLAAVAREHAIETFTLIVLPENRSMLGLLRRLGWIHQARFKGGVYEISFETSGGAENS
jgi:RimJ/RimL family protein N-acetyltransferase